MDPAPLPTSRLPSAGERYRARTGRYDIELEWTPEATLFEAKVYRHWSVAVRQSGKHTAALQSPAGHLLEMLGVTRPLHRDLRGGIFDFPQIGRREFDR